MNKYGLCRWNLQGGNQVTLVTDCPVNSFKESDTPSCMFFPSEEDRKYVMDKLLEANPGHIYCMFEITSAFRRQPGELSEYTVDKNGFLPK